MKGFLIFVLVVVLVAAGAYYLFPLWYLNSSPRVLIQPKSLVSTARPPTEIEGAHKPEEPTQHALSASDPLQLMYLDQPLETRMAAGFKQMQLGLPVVKIGIGTDGDYKVASIEFCLGDTSATPVLERELLDICYTAFRMVPTLQEIDVYGVDKPDTRSRRGTELVSMNIRKDVFVSANPRLSRSLQVAQLGVPWYSPNLGHTPLH